MGMLMHHTWKAQQEKAKKADTAEAKREEIPFAEPEKPVEKTERKSAGGRRKSV